MAVLSLAVFAIMSRLLTKAEFGKYAALTAVTTIFTALSEAGMGSALIQNKSLSKSYFDTAFNLSVYTGIIFTLILLVISRPLAILIVDESIVAPLRISSLCVLFYGLQNVVKTHLTRLLKFGLIGIYSAISYVIGAIIAIYMAYKGLGVYSIVVEQVITSFCTFIIFYITLPEKPQWFYVSKDCVKQILGYGGWLTASVLFRVIYQQMDKLLMSRWLSVELLGAYNRPAGFITNISSRLDGILDTVLFPILSSIQDDKARIARAYDEIIYLCGLYAGILCVTMLFAGNIIIDIFFGSEWRSIATVFYILVFMMLFSVIGRIMDCFIRSLAYVKMGFFMRIFACFITLGCLYVGKDYGIKGVAIAIVLSNYVITLGKLFYINIKISVPILHTLYVIFKSQLVILLPLIVFCLWGPIITSTAVCSMLSLIILCFYFVILFYFFPNLMGEYLHRFIQQKLKIKLYKNN